MLQLVIRERYTWRRPLSRQLSNQMPHEIDFQYGGPPTLLGAGL